MGTSGSEGGQGKPTSRKADRAPRPDPYTYVSTWAGWCYTAFVVDVFSQRILGWAIATTMDTRLVQDALAMAMWQRDQQGRPIIGGLVHHSDKGTQNTSIAFGESLELAGISPSNGSVGDSYDNALMETINGLYKNECIKPAGPIRNWAQAEYATADWVSWYNHDRLHSSLSYRPPIEYGQCQRRVKTDRQVTTEN